MFFETYVRGVCSPELWEQRVDIGGDFVVVAFEDTDDRLGIFVGVLTLTLHCAESALFPP